jgi:hypothetical protein
MTPTKSGKVTHIKIERKKKLEAQEGVVHVAGGQHQGLVVAKNENGGELFQLVFMIIHFKKFYALSNMSLRSPAFNDHLFYAASLFKFGPLQQLLLIPFYPSEPCVLATYLVVGPSTVRPE